MKRSRLLMCCSILMLGLSVLVFYSCTENGIQPAQDVYLVNSGDEEPVWDMGEIRVEDDEYEYVGVGPGVAVEFVVELTLYATPIHNNFTRYISFRTPLGDWKRVPVVFSKASYRVYRGKANATGLQRLSEMNDPYNRWYWDDMYIENRGGSTALSIKQIQIEIQYPEKDNFEMRILIADGYVWNTLNSGNHKIRINTQAETGRIKFSGVSQVQYGTFPLNLRTAILDFGKTGSDGAHGMMDSYNPKYGAGVEGMCSEFVSWYFHTAKVTITGATGTVYDFKDITYTKTAYNQFKDAKLLYRYSPARRDFYRDDPPYERYYPKPGDWLMRLQYKDGKQKWHSMIMFEWDKLKRTAIVVDGPRPVTKRTVDVSYLQTYKRHYYYIGRLPD